jgi:AbiV family abortive infection protein
MSDLIKLVPDEVARGISEVIINAKELVREANMLIENECYARGYALAHMACEELGKLPILFGIIQRLKAGESVDWKESWKRIRSHESKIYQFQGVAELFLQMRRDSGLLEHELDDLLRQLEIALSRKHDFGTHRNAALYTDIKDGEFVRPSSRVSYDDAKAALTIAEFHITIADRMFSPSESKVLETAKEMMPVWHSQKTIIDNLFATIKTTKDD